MTAFLGRTLEAEQKRGQARFGEFTPESASKARFVRASRLSADSFSANFAESALESRRVMNRFP